MKVSRKVGRHKRASSVSVSRRRLRNKKSYKKNSYRKKHTQQGGKYGKRGRVHKRMRTYKHGRRFHKGGKNMPLFGSVPPATIKWRKNDTWHVNWGYISNLRYKKSDDKGGYKDKYDDFIIIPVTRDVDTQGNKSYNFLFTKIGGKSDLEFLANSEQLQRYTGHFSNSLDNATEYLCNSIKNGYSVSFLIDRDRVYDFNIKFAKDPTLAEQVEKELAPAPLPDLSSY